MRVDRSQAEFEIPVSSESNVGNETGKKTNILEPTHFQGTFIIFQEPMPDSMRLRVGFMELRDRVFCFHWGADFLDKVISNFHDIHSVTQ